MGITFVVPDIHGRVDLLGGAVAAIAEHRPQVADRTIVFLGDYIDRGPSSRQVLERLMAGPGDASRWICLIGNHEDMMIQALEDPLHHEHWLDNGGEATVASYAGEDRSRMLRHARWARALPLVHADRHRVYVHASVATAIPLDEQPRQTLLWTRYPSGFGAGFRGARPVERHVVHGHTADERNPRTWGNRTCLDAGAYRHGRLAVGVFDDDVPGPPLHVLSVEGPALSELRAPRSA